MNTVILYLKDTYGVYQRADMFKDETLSMTSKIKDVKDISKVFTDFSESFTIPASKKNNKIFAHFDRYDIIGDSQGQGVYDSRKKIDAKLEINQIPFKEGKVFLNSVGMMDNTAYSYNITFYGNTVNLKTIFGDDKIQSLSFIDNFTHEWNNTNVKLGFINGLNFTVNSTTYVNPIIYPLITPTKRLFVDSGVEGGSHDFSGNLYYHSDHTHADTGLAYTDLKPAISVKMLIKGIEERYGIEFADGFFDSDIFDSSGGTNKGLYLWLSREKGIIGSGGEDAENILQDFTYVSGDAFSTYEHPPEWVDYAENSNSNLEFYTTPRAIEYNRFTFELSITQSGGDNYDIIVIDTNDNNKIKEEFTDLSGNQVFTYSTPIGEEKNRSYQILLKSTSSFVGSSTLKVKEGIYRSRGDALLRSYESTYNSSTITPVVSIRPTERIPDLKVYDFLSGLFKMFNLVAYFEENLLSSDYGKIKVMSLDDFYADDPTIYDITKYVDASKSTVEPAIPFTEINFMYKEPKTLLMLQHRESTNEVFGDSTYKPEGIDLGKKYDVKLPFAHMKYERIFDDEDGDVTDIQWGYSAGDNFKPDADATPPKANYDSVLSKPLLFYAQKTSAFMAWITPSYTSVAQYHKPSNAYKVGRPYNDPIVSGANNVAQSFRLIDTSSPTRFGFVDVGDIVYNTTNTAVATVISKISLTELELSADIFQGTSITYRIVKPPSKTINFDVEFDEWTRVNYGTDSQTLFSEYYKTYIEGVYNPRARMFKVTAHLPSRILLNYRLNDRFQVNDKVFVINSINTNLKTGECKLELLNIL
jgi:hypothetical protein